MKVLAIRTDKPEAELYLYDGNQKLAEAKWQAHHQLAETIHKKIKKILDLLSISHVDIQGIAVFKGPGSFTGLRIGISVANALAYGLNIPIVSASGKDWIDQGIKKLDAGKNERIVVPEYGRPPHTTKPKK